MSDLVTIGKHVIDWLLTRNSRRSAQIDEYIKNLQSKCQELVDIEDPTSERAILLHEQLKVIYELASSRLPRALIDHEGWNLYRGLSSARIYYWLRVVESITDNDQFEALVSERRTLSSGSLDILVNRLSDPTTNGKQARIDLIRTECLRDIARVLEMRPFY